MKRLLLVGAGHAHALVLRELCLRPLAGVDVCVVSPEPLAPYSGMVPGWLAGHYGFSEIVIDFPALAQAAGARWLQAEMLSLDPARRELQLDNGGTLDYDVLSLNVGSTLNPPASRHAQHTQLKQHTQILPLRPLSALRARYERLVQRFINDSSEQPFTVTAIGGGAAGFEALLAVLQRLRSLRPDRRVHGALLTRGTQLLPGLAPAARRAAQRALERAGVTVELGSGWSSRVEDRSDVVLWATGAEAQGWQRDPARRGALAVDDEGFIRIDEQLRSVSHPQVFATGDCASWPRRALPKAGVHAVRMGPVLAGNLRAALGGDGNPAGDSVQGASALSAHRPQRQFLALLSTGDGRAIASRGPFGAEGAWAWRWKDRIDRRFLNQFHALVPGSHPVASVNPGADPLATHSGENR